MNHPRYGKQPRGQSQGPGLPKSLDEAEQLAASIEAAVQDRTRGGIRNLSVEVGDDSVLLRGRCASYYTKQLAQTAAMGVSGEDRLSNQIEVA